MRPISRRAAASRGSGRLRRASFGSSLGTSHGRLGVWRETLASPGRKQASGHAPRMRSRIVQRRRLVGVGEDDRIEADAVVSGDVGETPAQDDPRVRWIDRADSRSRRRKRVSFVLCNGVGLVDPARGPARVGSGFAHGRKCSRVPISWGVRGRHLATCPVWSLFTQWMPWPSVALTVAGGGRCSSARRAMSSAS